MSYARDLARIARTGIASVNTAQELRDLEFYSGVPPETMMTFGALAEGDGGGGLWYWDETSTADDNLGACLLPTGRTSAGRWLRLVQKNTIDASWWGLTPGGTVDCSAVIQAAINYAETLEPVVEFSDPGYTVLVPQGTFLVNTPLLISKSGISISGVEGRGAELVGPGDIIRIGPDNYWGTRLWGCGVYNLVLTSNSFGSTSGCGIRIRWTVGTDIHNVEIWNFYIGIDCLSANTLWLLGCRIWGSSRTVSPLACIRLQGLDASAYTGSTYDPGGGIHMTDCELFGKESTTAATQHGMLIHSVDGLYLSQCHIVKCQTAMTINPQGTPENHTIATIQCSNVYFDGPAGNGDVGSCFAVLGKVSANVVMANGAVRASTYIDLTFVNTYFRAAAYAINCVIVSVDDLDTWESSGYRLTPLMFSACEFRRCRKTAITVVAGTDVRPGSVIIDGCYFERWNEDQQSGLAAISMRAWAANITDNIFSNEAPVPPDLGGDWVILIADPTDSAIVTSNDFTQAHVAEGGQFVRLGVTDTVNTITVDSNISPGPGRVATFITKGETADATTLEIPVYAVSESNGGTIDVALVGNGPSGGVITCRFRGSYRRVGTGALELSSSGDRFTASDLWNPGTLATPPEFGKRAGGSNTLYAYVTGKASETWTWAIRSTFVEAT